MKSHAGDADMATPSQKRARRSELPTFSFYSIVFSVEKNAKFKRILKIHQDGGQPISAHKF